MLDGFIAIQQVEISIQWRQIFDNETSEYRSLIFDETLPLTIEISKEKNKIQCILHNRLEWLRPTFMDAFHQ